MIHSVLCFIFMIGLAEVEQREPLRDNNTKTESKRRIALSIAKSWWRKIVIVLIPIILLPIPIVIDTQVIRHSTEQTRDS